MNTTSNESPRILCRIVRWWAALTEPLASPADAAASAGHKADCPSCRAYFESLATLETRLRHDARTRPSASPAGLEQRIAAAVRQAQHSTRRPQRRSFPLWAVGLGTAAAAVAIVLLLPRGTRPSQAAAEVAPADINAVFLAVTALPRQLGTLFALPDTRPAELDPLSHELDNVKADARSALNFLAANFLPAYREPASSLPDRNPGARDG